MKTDFLNVVSNEEIRRADRAHILKSSVCGVIALLLLMNPANALPLGLVGGGLFVTFFVMFKFWVDYDKYRKLSMQFMKEHEHKISASARKSLQGLFASQGFLLAGQFDAVKTHRNQRDNRADV